jgi:hypothetical protein
MKKGDRAWASMWWETRGIIPVFIETICSDEYRAELYGWQQVCATDGLGESSFFYFGHNVFPTYREALDDARLRQQKQIEALRKSITENQERLARNEAIAFPEEETE